MTNTDTTDRQSQRSSMLRGLLPPMLAKLEYPRTADDRERSRLERVIAVELTSAGARQALCAAELAEASSRWASIIEAADPADLPGIGNRMQSETENERKKYARYRAQIQRSRRRLCGRARVSRARRCAHRAARTRVVRAHASTADPDLGPEPEPRPTRPRSLRAEAAP